MLRPALPYLALALLAALASWVLWPEGGRGDLPEESERSATVPGRAAPQPADGGFSAGAKEAGGATRTDEEQTTRGEVGAAAEIVELDVVLLEQDGTPAGAGEVQWHDQRDNHSAEMGELRRRTSRLNLGTLAEHFGRRVEVGAGEVARLQVADGYLGISGGTESGWAQWKGQLDDLPTVEGRPRLELVLGPDCSVEVLVQDETGQPLEGIPVALFIGDEPPTGSAEITAVSDARGIVRIAHFFEEVRHRRRSDDFCWLAPIVPLAEVPRAEFDLFDPPTERMNLTLPALGSVRVLPERIDGSELGRLRVHLQRRMPEKWRARHGGVLDTWMLRESWLGHREAEVVDGVATFERVGLGLDLMIGTTFEDGGEMETLRLPGPTSAGEVLEVPFRQSKVAPRFRARLLLDGAPLADKRVQTMVLWPSRDGEHNTYATHRAQATVDADGGVECMVSGAPESAWGQLRLCFLYEEPGRAVAWVTEPLESPEQDGGNLGELRPDYEPLLIGRIVDPDGKPMAQRDVVMEMRAAGSMRNWQEMQAEYTYHVYRVLDVTTDAEGKFRVDGPASLGDMQVSTRNVEGEEGDLPMDAVAVDVAPGETDVLVRLQYPTALRGRILLDHFVDPTQFEAWILRRSESGYSRSGIGLSADGSFLRRIQSGEPCDFLLESRMLRRAVYRHEGFVPLGGQVVDLGEIDLRGTLTRRTLSVVGTDGQPLERVRVTIPGEDDWAWTGNLERNPDTLLCPTEAVEVKVEARDHRPKLVLLAQDEQEVTLSRGIPVTMQVTLDGELPEGCSLVVTGYLPPAENRPTQTTLDTRVLGPDGRCELMLPMPGTWSLRAGLQHKVGGSTNTHASIVSELVEVPEAGVSETVELQLTAEQLATFLERL